MGCGGTDFAGNDSRAIVENVVVTVTTLPSCECKFFIPSAPREYNGALLIISTVVKTIPRDSIRTMNVLAKPQSRPDLLVCFPSPELVSRRVTAASHL